MAPYTPRPGRAQQGFVNSALSESRLRAEGGRATLGLRGKVWWTPQ